MTDHLTTASLILLGALGTIALGALTGFIRGFRRRDETATRDEVLLSVDASGGDQRSYSAIQTWGRLGAALYLLGQRREPPEIDLEQRAPVWDDCESCWITPQGERLDGSRILGWRDGDWHDDDDEDDGDRSDGDTCHGEQVVSAEAGGLFVLLDPERERPGDCSGCQQVCAARQAPPQLH